jgi:hypothetical protein
MARKGPRDPDGLNIQFCVWIIVMFLISPISWDHHLVHVLPAIYLGVLYGIQSKSKLLLVLAGAIAIFLAANFPSNDPFFRRGVWTLLISSQLFAIGLLWLYFIYLSFRKDLTLPSGSAVTEAPAAITP